MEATKAYLQTHGSGFLMTEELCKQIGINHGHVIGFQIHEDNLYLVQGNDLQNGRTVKSGAPDGFAYVEDVLATLSLAMKYGELFGPLRFELPKLPHEEGETRSFRLILIQDPVTS